MARHLCAAVLLGLALPLHAGTLVVELSNLWPHYPVSVELYQDEASWNARRPALRKVVAATGTRQAVRFDALQPGRYAVWVKQRGPDVRWLKFAPQRQGASGTAFGRRLPFAAAAIEVQDDPSIRVRLVEAFP